VIDHQIPETLTQNVNATMHIAMCVVALMLALSFNRDMLEKKVSRTLFITIITSMIALTAYTISAVHHPEGHDVIYFTASSIAYLAIYAAEYMYLLYMVLCINHQRKNPIPRTELYFTFFFCAVSALVWILSVGDDRFSIPEYPDSNYGIYFWVSHLGEWALAVACALLFIWYRRLMKERHMLPLLILPTLMLISSLVEPFILEMSLRGPAFIVGLLLVLTRYHLQVIGSGSHSSAGGLDSRFRFTANRMKPHFINNILSTIFYLCDLDVKRAQDTTMDFSGYMMGTLETVDYSGLVPFTREMGTVNSYLSLEKLRFEDKLNVELDIKEKDFEIPPLTIESLVENSVKHGIAGKEDPSTLTISTRRLADGGIQIKVSDDGIGFDTSDSEKMNGELAYIKDIFDSEMGGRMSVKSAPGKGTTVTIKLPNN